jgi:hypothetical protein
MTSSTTDTTKRVVERADHRRDLDRPRQMANLRWALTLTFTRLDRSFDESQKKKEKQKRPRKKKMRLFFVFQQVLFQHYLVVFFLRKTTRSA